MMRSLDDASCITARQLHRPSLPGGDHGLHSAVMIAELPYTKPVWLQVVSMSLFSPSSETAKVEDGRPVVRNSAICGS